MELPSTTFDDILQCPENMECVDCGASPTKYVSVNNAVFICGGCKKEHNELIPSISLTKPLSEELLSSKELTILLLGGNKKFRAFMYQYGLAEFPIKLKYKTNAAEYYRLNVQLQSGYINSQEQWQEGRRWRKNCQVRKKRGQYPSFQKKLKKVLSKQKRNIKIGNR
eukprot:TRINITY_DN12803_c0_g1_i2.p1 TRINITY_DN12803_c0_g1~~TRINITY_DN12803_c0_g1_i2.p1  ORF type:complete len:167 (+),score=13.80 TRINITY_DN12803_c0_g1_i2:113-613(+)